MLRKCCSFQTKKFSTFVARHSSAIIEIRWLVTGHVTRSGINPRAIRSRKGIGARTAWPTFRGKKLTNAGSNLGVVRSLDVRRSATVFAVECEFRVDPYRVGSRFDCKGEQHTPRLSRHSFPTFPERERRTCGILCPLPLATMISARGEIAEILRCEEFRG